MTNPALLIIEEAYSMALNPTQDYGAQLEPLAASGELANRLSSNKVLFKLCMIVDAQAKEIQSLKDALLKKEEANDSTIANTTKLDPSQPLQS